MDRCGRWRPHEGTARGILLLLSVRTAGQVGSTANSGMTAERSYLVCATPRSGSTLVCQALKETGVAGRPEEYFEALRKTGRPRRPEQYFVGVDDESFLDHLGERNVAEDPQPRSP